LSSFWTCLGLLVRRWFQPASPSLGALRERLRTLSREACDAERRFEELALRRRVAEEQWRELATPLESLDFALAYLQRLRVSCRQEARQCLAAVDQEIQDAVLGSEIQVLIAKCRQLAGAVDPASILHAVLMLKQALLGFDASSGPATDEIHPLSGTPADRLAQAIEAGFVWGEGSATGEMHLQGEGRQRVRARPGSASPVSTASPRLRSLRPARGSLVEVSLSGCLPVTFSFRFRRWTAEALSRWLAAEARYHFQLGWHHPAALQRREGRAATEATAAQLTAEIRRLWEQAARCDAPAAS
jgi:hypothetical protein